MNPEQDLALPAINVSVPQEIPQRKELVQSNPDFLGKMFDSIISDIDKDRGETDDILKKFLEMVMNEGDASGSSKEAVVNLIKTKSDLSDKKIKLVDLAMRAYLKEANTFPKYLAATQNNKITIQGGMRSLIQSIRDENAPQEQS